MIEKINLLISALLDRGNQSDFCENLERKEKENGGASQVPLCELHGENLQNSSRTLYIAYQHSVHTFVSPCRIRIFLDE